MDFTKISWDASGSEIEAESFRRIDLEYAGRKDFSPEEWTVARRLIHTTGDSSITENLVFSDDPISKCLEALKKGALLYCDSNMIKAGISLPKLKKLNPDYSADKLICRIADQDIMKVATERKISRALASVEAMGDALNGSIILCGNAPLALAACIRNSVEKAIVPAMIIGVPVGFVNVVESKELLMETSIPNVTIKGRRGGSPLAVAILHGILESAGVRL